MKVLWTASALAQLQAIHDYLAQTSPDYAVRIIDRLFPNSGQMVPEYDRKEIREVIEGRYRVVSRERASFVTGCLQCVTKRITAYVVCKIR